MHFVQCSTKKVGASMNVSKAQAILIISILLFGGVVFSSVLNPVSAQYAQAASTPTPNTLPTLQSIIATQQIQIEELQRDLTFETKNREFNVRDLYWTWGIAVAVASAVVGILSWIGKKNLNDLQADWDRKSQQMLDKAVYKLDPGNLPIYLPAGQGFEGLHNTLQKRKFGKIGFYNNLDEFNKSNSQGVIVISLASKNESEQTAILNEFKTLIEQQLPDGSKTGFIIYAPGDIRVPSYITGCYDNLVTANFPATVISMVFAVGRGLDIVPN